MLFISSVSLWSTSIHCAIQCDSILLRPAEWARQQIDYHIDDCAVLKNRKVHYSISKFPLSAEWARNRPIWSKIGQARAHRRQLRLRQFRSMNETHACKRHMIAQQSLGATHACNEIAQQSLVHMVSTGWHVFHLCNGTVAVTTAACVRLVLLCQGHDSRRHPFTRMITQFSASPSLDG